MVRPVHAAKTNSHYLALTPWRDYDYEFLGSAGNAISYNTDETYAIESIASRFSELIVLHFERGPIVLIIPKIRWWGRIPDICSDEDLVNALLKRPTGHHGISWIYIGCDPHPYPQRTIIGRSDKLFILQPLDLSVRVGEGIHDRDAVLHNMIHVNGIIVVSFFSYTITINPCNSAVHFTNSLNHNTLVRAVAKVPDHGVQWITIAKNTGCTGDQIDSPNFYNNHIIYFPTPSDSNVNLDAKPKQGGQ